LAGDRDGEADAAEAAGLAVSTGETDFVEGADAGLGAFWEICGCWGFGAGNSAGGTEAVSVANWG
jgi:hypothetical protein